MHREPNVYKTHWKLAEKTTNRETDRERIDRGVGGRNRERESAFERETERENKGERERVWKRRGDRILGRTKTSTRGTEG